MRLPHGFRRISTAVGPIGLPSELRLLPAVDAVVFPRAPTVLRAVRSSSAELLLDVGPDADGDAVIGVVAQQLPTQWPAACELFDVGCAVRLTAMRDDGPHVEALIIGGPIFRIVELDWAVSPSIAQVEAMAVPECPPVPVDQARDSVLRDIARAVLYAELGERTPAYDLVDSLRHPADLASVCLSCLQLPIAELQTLLVGPPEARLARAVGELVTGRRAEEHREEILTLAARGQLRKAPRVLSR